MACEPLVVEEGSSSSALMSSTTVSLTSIGLSDTMPPGCSINRSVMTMMGCCVFFLAVTPLHITWVVSKGGEVGMATRMGGLYHTYEAASTTHTVFYASTL